MAKQTAKAALSRTLNKENHPYRDKTLMLMAPKRLHDNYKKNGKDLRNSENLNTRRFSDYDDAQKQKKLVELSFCSIDEEQKAEDYESPHYKNDA